MSLLDRLASAVASLTEEPTPQALDALDDVTCDLVDDLDPPREQHHELPDQARAGLGPVLELSDAVLRARETPPLVVWLPDLARAAADVERALLRSAA